MITIDKISRRLSQFPYSKFDIGDVLSIYFFVKGKPRAFRGICIGISKKNFKTANSSFTLRNVFTGIAIEQCVSIFNNPVTKLKLLKYEKKKLFYKKSKLFYLRNKLNRESQIRSGLF